MGNNSNYRNNNNKERKNNGGYNNGFNNRKPQKREKVKPVTLATTVLDFEDGINNIIGIVDVVKDIINGHPSVIAGTEELSEKLVKEAIVMDIADNTPIYGDRATQFYSLTMNFLKTFYKTAKYVGFGWEAIRSQDRKYIDGYTFKITLYSDREEYKNIQQRLEAVGFEVEEAAPRR